jgi:hypothetical protein
VTTIILPNSVTNLGSSVFSNCTGLEAATLSTNLANLQNAVFLGCSKLTSIIIPDSVTNIGGYAFSSCVSLTNVTIGKGVRWIGGGAFAGCTNLVKVDIPASTISIDVSADFSAFGGTTSLSAINVDGQNSAYSSLDGVLFDKSQTTLILYPQAKVLSDYLMPNSVTTLGPTAFYNCTKLTSVTIGNKVAYIPSQAFSFCTSLTRLTIPDSVTNIQDALEGKIYTDGAFASCTSLTNVTVGKGLTYIGLGAFNYCTNLTGIYFQGDAPSFGEDILNAGMGGDVFARDNAATGYYLPGTFGWSATFDYLPMVLWNPQAQTADGSFGVRMNHFGFNITGTADIPLVVEASTTLAARSWVPLQSCTLTNGSIYFNDPQWTNYPAGVYRIRSP